MSYNSLLIELCDLVQVTETKWGDRTETTTAGVPCRFVWKQRIVRNMQGDRIVRNMQGEEQMSAGRVFFKKGVTIKATTKILFDGERFGVLQIRKPADSTARHHIEVDIA